MLHLTFISSGRNKNCVFVINCDSISLCLPNLEVYLRMSEKKNWNTMKFVSEGFKYPRYLCCLSNNKVLILVCFMSLLF